MQSSMEVDSPDYAALMNHLTRGYEPSVQTTSIQSLPNQHGSGPMVVDISSPRTPVAGAGTQLKTRGCRAYDVTSWDAKE
eukprot:340276-Amphidinium_carterae.1